MGKQRRTAFCGCWLFAVGTVFKINFVGDISDGIGYFFIIVVGRKVVEVSWEAFGLGSFRLERILKGVSVGISNILRREHI
jgi:hypothetical protein